MKILKYIIGLFALLLLGLLAVGLFTPAVNYTTEVEVNKPIAESWAVFSDESRLHEWIPAYKGMEIIEGEKDVVGSKYKLTMVEGGKEFEMTETLVANEKEERFAMHFDSEMMEQDVNVQFTAKDENTTLIKVDGEVSGKGIINRSVFALMKGSFKKSNDEFYKDLKHLIETNTVDYFPAPPPMEADTTEF